MFRYFVGEKYLWDSKFLHYLQFITMAMINRPGGYAMLPYLARNALPALSAFWGLRRVLANRSTYRNIAGHFRNAMGSRAPNLTTPYASTRNRGYVANKGFRRGYKKRRFARRKPGLRKALMTKKSQKGARVMRKFDTGLAWRGSGSHMLMKSSVPTLASGTSSYYSNWGLNAPFSYCAQAFAAGQEVYPTGMRHKSIQFEEYRCNGGKLSLKILNMNTFGFTVYWKYAVVTADVNQIDQNKEFIAMEANDLDHGHGCNCIYVPPAHYDNDGVTIIATCKKIKTRWRTRDLIKGTCTMNDMWRVFEYPNNPNWNDAATGCDPVKDSNSNWKQTTIYFAFRYIADFDVPALLTFNRHTWDGDHARIRHTWKVRSYCQYRKPRELDPNVSTAPVDHCTGRTGEEIERFTDPV